MSMLGKSPGFSLFQVPSSPLPPPLPHSPALLNACAAPLPPRLLPPPRLTLLPCSARARLSRSFCDSISTWRRSRRSCFSCQAAWVPASASAWRASCMHMGGGKVEASPVRVVQGLLVLPGWQAACMEGWAGAQGQFLPPGCMSLV